MSIHWCVTDSTVQRISEDELLKHNALRLADHHREHCDGTCNVMLWALQRLLERAGIPLSIEERRRFL